MCKYTKSIVVIMLLLVLQFTAYGSTIKELENEKDSIKNNIEDIKQREEKTQIEINNISVQIGKLQDDIGATEQKIYELELSIEEAKAHLKETQEQLAQAKEDEKVYFEMFKLRLKNIYENTYKTQTEVSLEENTFMEGSKISEYTKQMADYDENIIEKLKQAKLAIETAEAEEQKALDALGELEQVYAKELATLKDKKQSLDTKLKELEKYISDLSDMREDFEADWDALDEKIKKMKISQKYDGGFLMWPAPNYYRITSHFGNRIDPINGKPWFHYGTDIAVPTGSPIVAAADGTIVEARWKGGYGYAVVINHGGLVTLYGHNSKLLVKAGDVVKRGQTIALSGSTGRSTGPHLHFEVRLNNKCVQPLDYFKK